MLVVSGLWLVGGEYLRQVPRLSASNAWKSICLDTVIAYVCVAPNDRLSKGLAPEKEQHQARLHSQNSRVVERVSRRSPSQSTIHNPQLQESQYNTGSFSGRKAHDRAVRDLSVRPSHNTSGPPLLAFQQSAETSVRRGQRASFSTIVSFRNILKAPIPS